MATAKRPRSSDGLELVGREQGKLKYLARLKKKQAGKVLVDTEKVILADNKAEALVLKAKMLEELVAAKLGTRTKTRKRLGDAIEEWLPTLRKGTRMSWGSHLRKFEALGRDRYLDDISAQEMQRIIATAKVSDKTAASVRMAIVALYEWAKEQGYVAKNAAKETVRRKTRKTSAELLAEQEAEPEREAMTVEEVNALLLALLDQSPDFYVLAGTQFLLGCRFGEASALRWSDISESGVVRVRVAQLGGELGVTKRKKPREAALGPGWLAVLREHRTRLDRLGWPGADEYCFPARPGGRRRDRSDVFWSYETVRRALHVAFQLTGIQVRGVTHSLRHTMITLAQAEGPMLAVQYLTGGRPTESSLQTFVGHASPEMTAHYTHVPHANLIDFAEAFERRVRSKGK